MEKMKKALSILLCLCMLLQNCPVIAFAVAEDNLCEHHTAHTADCGYAEASAGQDCTHIHDELCGYAEAVAEVKCACEATDENGALVHTEGCGYVAPVAGADCTHSHDETCGYVAAVEAHECHYVCAECAAAPASEESSEESSEPAPVCDCGTDDALIHATTCPVYVAPENPQCYCAEKCTEVNVWCDVCGFDHTQCGGTDTAVTWDGVDLSSNTASFGNDRGTWYLNPDNAATEFYNLIDDKLMLGAYGYVPERTYITTNAYDYRDDLGNDGFLWTDCKNQTIRDGRYYIYVFSQSANQINRIEYIVDVQLRYTVNISVTGAPSGSGGVTLNGSDAGSPQYLQKGGSMTLTVKDVQSHKHTVTFDNGVTCSQNGDTYAFSNVNKSFTFKVVYEADEFATVSFGQPEGATISVNGNSTSPVQVIAGMPYTVSVKTSDGYYLTGITVDGTTTSLDTTSYNRNLTAGANGAGHTISVTTAKVAIPVNTTASITYTKNQDTASLLKAIKDAVYAGSGSDVKNSLTVRHHFFGDFYTPISNSTDIWESVLTAENGLSCNVKESISIKLSAGDVYSQSCTLYLYDGDISAKGEIKKDYTEDPVKLDGNDFNCACPANFSSSYPVEYRYYTQSGQRLSSAPTEVGKYQVQVKAKSYHTNPGAILGTDWYSWSGLIPFEIVSVPSYSITVENSSDGRVIASKETSIAGKTVTLTVEPNEGYLVGTVAYNGTPITPVEGVYSFTMPAGAVTISATFGACTHETYENGICTLCGVQHADHTGSEPTCIQKAVCEICGLEYGELADHSTGAEGDRAATCQALAYCSVCESEYGELAAHSFGSSETCTYGCGTQAQAKVNDFFNDNATYYYATLPEALAAAEALGSDGVEDGMSISVYPLADDTGDFTIPGDFIIFYGNGYTFTGTVTNDGNIEGGTFSGEVTNNAYIERGTFNGEVTNRNFIRGGTFNGKVTNHDTIWNISSGRMQLGENFSIENNGTIDCRFHFWKDGACRLCAEVCEHTSTGDNVATCVKPAVCDTCGASYGEASGHSPAEDAIYTDNGNGTHLYDCTLCGISVAEEHSFENNTHKCICGAIETFTVTVNDGNENIIVSLTNATATYGQDFTAELTSDEGNPHYEIRWYTVDGVKYEDATYENGSLTIPAARITGDLEIRVYPYVTVTFHGNGGVFRDPASGEKVSSKVLTCWYGENQHFLRQSEMVREGYGFINFNTKPDGTGTAYIKNNEYVVTEDLVLYAQWEVNAYTLQLPDQTLDVGYGTALADALTGITPEKTGYAHTGWTYYYLDEDDVKQPYTGTTMPAFELYAQPVFAPIEYTITWDMSGCTYDVSNYSVLPAKLAYNADGDAYIVNFTSITAPEGYEFVRFEDGDGNALSCDVTDQYSLNLTVSGDMTVKAVIQPKTYKTTWVSFGGSSLSVNFKYGETINVCDHAPVPGYSFLRWEGYTSGMTMPAKDLTFTAIYQVNQYTITFNTDGGSEVASITQDYGTAVTAPEAPSRDGYHFVEWQNLPATMPAQDVTVRAVWEAHKDYTYSVSGNTITATCGVCEAEVGSASITAESKTYGAAAVEAALTKTGVLEDESLAVAYAVKNGAPLDGAPVNAGTYTASVTLGEGEAAATVTVEFTIAKKELTATVSGSMTKSYDGTDAVPERNSLKIVLDGVISGDKVAASADFAFAGINAGTTTINATNIALSGKDAENYKLKVATASADVGQILPLNVNSLEPHDYDIVFGTEPVYNGKEQAMTVERFVMCGMDVTYELTGNTGTEAGFYTMTVTATGNFAGTITQDWQLHKKAVTVTAKDQTLTYGQTISQTEITANGLADGHSVTVTLTPSTTNVTISGTITANAAVITADGTDVTDNYNVSYTSGKLVIKPDTASIDALSTENVTSANEEEIKAVQAMMASAESDGIDEATAAEWTAITEKCEDLIEKIEAVKAENSRISDAAADFDQNTVKSTDEAAITALIKDIENLLNTENLTEDERAALETLLEQVEGMIETIENTTADRTEVSETMEALDPETVTSDDKGKLEQVIETIDQLLQKDHLTEEERKGLEDTRAEAEELLEKLKAVQDALDTENTKKVEDVTADNVLPKDKEALENAKADLEKALEDNAGNYTEAEKQAVQEEIDRIANALEALENVQDVTKIIQDLPQTVEPDDEENAEKILDAKVAYDALTDHEKSLVEEDLKEKLEDLVYALTDYEIIRGNNGKWSKGTEKGLKFVANGPFSKFVGVKVDDEEVFFAFYKAEEGSTIVTLKPMFLSLLKTGWHTITILFEDGEVTGNFKILPRATSPATGDNSQVALWGGIAAVSLLCVAVLILNKKKIFKK